MLHTSHLFSRLTEEQLERVADRFSAFLYEEGKVIFNQDDRSESFFFIFSGQVTLNRFRSGKDHEYILEDSDYFGLEVLGEHPGPRKARATARTNTRLLRLASDDLAWIESEFPQVKEAFRRARHTFDLLMDLDTPWKAPREVIRFIDRPHWIFLLAKIAPPVLVSSIIIAILAYLTVVVLAGAQIIVILLVAFTLAGLGWTAWEWIDFFNDFVVITNRRVALLTRVILFYDSRQEVPMDAVLSDDVRTNQWGRIFGYGNILVRTYTGEIILSRLRQPLEVVDIINEMRIRVRNVRGQAHQEVIKKRIDQIVRQDEDLGEEDEESTQAETLAQPPVEVQTGKMPNFLSDMLSLRVEADGVISYRTHWWILIKRTFLPALFNAVLWVFLIAVLTRSILLPVRDGLVVFVALGPILFLWWLYQFIDWYNDRYIITRDTLVDVFRKPLGIEQKRTAPIKNILSVDFERLGLIGLLLDFGTVFIRIGEETFTFNNVNHPSDVQREIFQRFTDIKVAEEDRAQQKIDDQLAEWISEYHRQLQERAAGEDDEDEDDQEGEDWY